MLVTHVLKNLQTRLIDNHYNHDDDEILEFVHACINFDQFVKDIPILWTPKRTSNHYN